MNASTYLAWSLALAGLAGAATAIADPLGMYGFGARSTAMGGAVSADVEDLSANYYNPGGIVRGQSARIDLGYAYSINQLSSNGVSNNVAPVHGISGGILLPGTLYRIPFALSVAVWLPDGGLLQTRTVPQSEPRWVLYDSLVQTLYAGANIAVAPVRWLRIGGGLSFISGSQGSLEVYGDIGYVNTSLTSLQHTVNVNVIAVRAPQAGVQIDVARDLTLSAVYRGSYQLSIGLDAAVNGNILVGARGNPNTTVVAALDLRASYVSVFEPQQVVVGGAWKIVPNLTFAADVTWENWSAFQNPSAHLDVGLTLQIPPALGGLVLPSVPMGNALLNPNFHDTFVPRLGVEWRIPVGVHTVALRAGYHYDPSPVPDQVASSNYMDANRHVFAAGAGIVIRGLQPVFNGSIGFDVFGSVQVLENRVVLKADPTDPVGDYTLSGTVYSFGTNMNVAF